MIEHVPDPIATLKECARLLKKGGKLVLATPNQESMSHRTFGKDWRGLEPPRHLHIFSPSSLNRALNQAGLNDVAIRPVIAFSVIYESTLLRRGNTGPAATNRGNRSASLKAHFYNIAELFVTPWKPAAADCIMAVATKN